jgi:hypothetical protein
MDMRLYGGIGSVGLRVLLCILSFAASADPAPGPGVTQPAKSPTFILAVTNYEDELPYKVKTLPLKGWVGIAPEKCELLATDIQITGGGTGVYSPVPNVALIVHGVQLRPGRFECATRNGWQELTSRRSNMGIDRYPVFRFRGKPTSIKPKVVGNQTQLIFTVGQEHQCLYQFGPKVHLEDLDVDIIGDLDRDGRPDLVLFWHLWGQGEKAHTVLYLSSRAEPGMLVGEVASHAEIPSD